MPETVRFLKIATHTLSVEGRLAIEIPLIKENELEFHLPLYPSNCRTERRERGPIRVRKSVLPLSVCEFRHFWMRRRDSTVYFPKHANPERYFLFSSPSEKKPRENREGEMFAVFSGPD